MTATSVHGHDLTIHCRAVYFKRVFRRAFMPSRRMAVYSINATVSADAPERMQQGVGDFSVNIPRDCGCFMNEPQQKQRAVEAYLDLLLATLDRRQTDRLFL